MSALRAGSPISRSPPIAKAPISAEKEWEKNTASGKRVKKRYVRSTNHFFSARSAKTAAGRYETIAVPIRTDVRRPNRDGEILTTSIAQITRNTSGIPSQKRIRQSAISSCLSAGASSPLSLLSPSLLELRRTGPRGGRGLPSEASAKEGEGSASVFSLSSLSPRRNAKSIAIARR